VWSIAIDVIVQMVVGAVLGYLIGAAARWLIARVRLPASGFYPVLTIAVALLAFALPTLASGSGFLAVYIVALMLGNAPLPYRTGLARVHDALAWLSQVAMFLMFGILSFPSRLIDVAVTGLALGLFLAFIARPVVVALCLLPFRFPRREVTYIGWVGLRGAVPIILATFPVLIDAPGAKRIFDVVFFIVVLNAFLPGATVPWITRRLGLEARVAPKPPAVLEIESLQPLGGELMSFYIDEALAVAGVPLADLPFPQGASVLLIEHGRQLIAPRGDTVLQPGDHVYVFAEEHARAVVHLLFGSQ
jgi:cell volume regulation protein A